MWNRSNTMQLPVNYLGLCDHKKYALAWLHRSKAYYSVVRHCHSELSLLWKRKGLTVHVGTYTIHIHVIHHYNIMYKLSYVAKIEKQIFLNIIDISVNQMIKGCLTRSAHHPPTPGLLPWVHACFRSLCKVSWTWRFRENLSNIPLKIL